MIAREEGPWRVFSRMRHRFANVAWGDVFSCVKCISLWIAIPFAFFVNGSWLEIFVIWLALSGVTALIDEWIHPPFEWEESTDNGMLQRENEGADD